MPFGRRGRRPVVRGVARTAVVAGTATAVSGRVRRRQDAKYTEQEQQAYDEQQAAAQQAAPQQAPPPPAATGSTDDLVAQLENLGKLRDEGLLTDEEFAAQKAKLLG